MKKNYISPTLLELLQGKEELALEKRLVHADFKYYLWWRIEGVFAPQLGKSKWGIEATVGVGKQYTCLEITGKGRWKVIFNPLALRQSLDSYASGSVTDEEPGFLDSEINNLDWIDDNFTEEAKYMREKTQEEQAQFKKLQQLQMEYPKLLAKLYFCTQSLVLNPKGYAEEVRQCMEKEANTYRLLQEVVNRGREINAVVVSEYEQRLPSRISDLLTVYNGKCNRLSSTLADLQAVTRKAGEALILQAALFYTRKENGRR